MVFGGFAKWRGSNRIKEAILGYEIDSPCFNKRTDGAGATMLDAANKCSAYVAGPCPFCDVVEAGNDEGARRCSSVGGR